MPMLQQMEETLNCRLLSMGLQSLEKGGGGQCYFFVWASHILNHPQLFSGPKFKKLDFRDRSVPALAQKIREWTVGELRRSVEYKRKFDEFFPDEGFEVFLFDLAKSHTHVNELVIRFVSEITGFYQEIIYYDTTTFIEPRSGVDCCCDENKIRFASRRECFLPGAHQFGHYMAVVCVFKYETNKAIVDASSWTFVGKRKDNDTHQLVADVRKKVQCRINTAQAELISMVQNLAVILSASTQATTAAQHLLAEESHPAASAEHVGHFLVLKSNEPFC